MNEKLREKLRDKILELYQLDIDKAECKFSTQNYAFIFPDEEFMIRVSPKPVRNRSETLGELLWIDDLKNYKETICEPIPSINNSLIEDVMIDDKLYRISKFRTAVGSVVDTENIRPMFLIAVGDLLGTIHHISEEEQKIGLHFKRTNIEDHFKKILESVQENIDEDLKTKAQNVLTKIQALPKDFKNYGLNHGDFHNNNFFVHENNIWLFDFADSLYAPYLYDIASFIISIIQFGYKAGKDPKKIIEEDILPYFKIGYSLNRDIDDSFWDDLSLLMELRLLLIAIVLYRIEDSPLLEDFNKVKEYYQEIAKADNMLEKFYELSQKYGALR